MEVFVLETVPKILDVEAGLLLFPNRPVPEVEVLKGEGSEAGALVPNKEGVEVVTVPNMFETGFGAPKRDGVVLVCCCWLLLEPNPPDPKAFD